MKLTDRKWKPFYIGKIFDEIVSGKAKGRNHLKHDDKGVSYIGATNRNNGVLDFVAPTNALQPGNAIGFIKNGNGAGSAGHAIYKAESFMSTSDVIYGYAKWLNRYVGLFFTTCSDMNEDKFSHGYKWTPERIKRSLVSLPVDVHGEPDYAFMEAYIRERENALLERYSAFVKSRTIPCRGGVRPLRRAVWRAFSVKDLGMVNSHGTRLTKADRIKGPTPLLTAGFANNGIAEYISNSDMPMHEHFISVDMFGMSFWHPYRATGDDNIYFFEHKGLSDATKQFISVCINQQRDKYSYGKQFRQPNADKLKVMLPATSDGKPDFAYMDAYGRKVMLDRLEKYLAYRHK